MNQWDESRGVYSISIAADLVGTGVHNLRVYEARGLLNPARSEGGTRRYSERDVQVLREISRLLGAGLNLAGVEMVLELQDRVRELEDEVRRLSTMSEPGGTPG